MGFICWKQKERKKEEEEYEKDEKLSQTGREQKWLAMTPGRWWLHKGDWVARERGKEGEEYIEREQKQW